MPSYTIDASNNTEPLDTRYVADFPAELRAMKSRMNQAINDQGQLSGGLKTDGTNYMTVLLVLVKLQLVEISYRCWGLQRLLVTWL